MQKSATQISAATKRTTLLLTIIATSLSVLFLQLVIHESQRPDTFYGYIKASVLANKTPVTTTTSK